MSRVECAQCGEDCSAGYTVFRGWPFHFCCLPVSNRKRKKAVRDNEQSALTKQEA
jgi:hypothetical protein